MDINNIKQIRLELLQIPFHVYLADVAVAYVETEYKTHVFCFSDRDQFIDNVHKDGVGAERLRGALSEEFGENYTAICVENSSEKLFLDYILERYEGSELNDFVIGLTDGTLKTFWDMPESGAVRDQLNKAIGDDILDRVAQSEKAKSRTDEDVFRAHGLFDAREWVYRELDEFAVCEHSGGSMFIIEEMHRHHLSARIDFAEDVYNDLIELPGQNVSCKKLIDIVSQLTDTPVNYIKVESGFTVSKIIKPEGEEIELKFDALPYLITNTTVNYNLGKVELRHVSNEARLLVADLDNPNCLGVLLDFTNPTVALKMLDILKRNNCNIYIIQENEDGPEVVIYRNATTTTDRRRRR